MQMTSRAERKRNYGPEQSVPPLLAPELMKKPFHFKMEKRHDERSHFQHRPTFILTDTVPSASGSALIELQNTKVLCVTNGPYLLPKRLQHPDECLFSVEFKYAPFSQYQSRQSYLKSDTEKEYAAVIKEAMVPFIRAEKYPCCGINLFVYVLVDDGNILGAAMTAASVSLAQSGIEMVDLSVATSLLVSFDEKLTYLIDPTKDEEEMANDTNTVGKLSIAYSPALDSLSQIYFRGTSLLKPEILTSLIDILVTYCKDELYPTVQSALLEHAEKSKEASL